MAKRDGTILTMSSLVHRWVRPVRTYFKRYVPTRHRKIIVISGAVALCLGVALLVWITGGVHKLTPLETVNRTYSTQLSNLYEDTQRLPPTVWPGKTLASDLADYDEQLYEMQGYCNTLHHQYQQSKDWKLPTKTKDGMSQVEMLCGDLLGVLQYSQNIYHSLHSYLLLPTTPFPDASQHFDYVSQLNTVERTATSAKTQLHDVNSTATQDPAQQELEATLDTTLQLTAKAQAAIEANDLATANDLARQLTQKLTADHRNFLTARSYFWKNTIQVDKLQRAIATQNVVFAPAKAQQTKRH